MTARVVSGFDKIGPPDIVAAVATQYRLTPSDVVGPTRTRQILLARQVAMYLCRRLTDLSCQQIGDFFGGRDHTTVMHAERKLEARVSEHQSVRTEIDQIRTRLATPGQ